MEPEMTKTNCMSAYEHQAIRGIVMYAPGYNRESQFAALSDSEFYALLQEFKRSAKRLGDAAAHVAADRYQDRMLEKL